MKKNKVKVPNYVSEWIKYNATFIMLDNISLYNEGETNVTFDDILVYDAGETFAQVLDFKIDIFNFNGSDYIFDVIENVKEWISKDKANYFVLSRAVEYGYSIDESDSTNRYYMCQDAISGVLEPVFNDFRSAVNFLQDTDNNYTDVKIFRINKAELDIIKKSN